jgi:hypothetical protein
MSAAAKSLGAELIAREQALDLSMARRTFIGSSARTAVDRRAIRASHSLIDGTDADGFSSTLA